MNDEPSGQQPQHVGYAGYLDLWGASAIGSVVAIGLVVLLLLGYFFGANGRQTPVAFIIALAVFLPIILTYLEVVFARGRQNLSSLYSLLATDSSVPFGFLNGWLLLGGLLALGASIAWAAGLHVNQLLSDFFAIDDVDLRFLAVFLLLLVVANQLLGTSGNWRTRSLILLSGIIVAAGLVVTAIIRPVASLEGYVYVPSSGDISGLGVLAVGLWGVAFFLENRRLVRPGSRAQLLAPILPYVGMALLGAGFSFALLRYPQLAVNDLTPFLTLAKAIGPLWELVLGGLFLAIALLALNQTVASVVRLTGQLAEDGVLPAAVFQRITGKQNEQNWLPLVIGLAIIPIAAFLSLDMTLSLAAIGLMGATVLIHASSIFRSATVLPPGRLFRLPFQPLFPVVTAAVSLTIVLLQPASSLTVAGAWLLIGGAYFLLYARQAIVSVRQTDEIVAEPEGIPAKGAYRILVCVSNPASASSLVRAGREIAAAQFGDVLVLAVVVATEQGTAAQQRQTATAKREAVQQAIGSIDEDGVTVTTLVRLAPTVADGIHATAWEVKADSILLGWPESQVPATIAGETVVEAVVRLSRSEVMVLHGEYPARPVRIMAPMTSYGHSPAALRLGQSLVSETQGEVVALTLVRQKLTPSLEASLETRLQDTVDKMPDSSYVSTDVVQITDMVDDVTSISDSYDLVMLGMSDEGLMADTVFGGMPVEAAEKMATPALVVKSPEVTAEFWLRRVWMRLTSVLPRIDMRQKSAVYLSMRRGARATVDFYVLIILSASIAFFGLVQNSGAVIIGAMLVAPLMSPIMALAHGVVRGNVAMLRQALDAAIRGAIMAITVATLLTLVLLVFGFTLEPTPEILSRTQPNLIDLLVALASGAAAAYAISRSELAAALPGVSIAVALVPPLAVVGFGLGTLRFDIAYGSLLLFATNLAAIVLAGAVTFILLGFRPPPQAERDDETRHSLRMTLLAIILIAIPLGYATIQSNRQTVQDSEIRSIVESYWPPSEAQVNELTIRRQRRDVYVDFTVYDFGAQIDDADLAQLQNEIVEEIGRELIMDTIVVQTTFLTVGTETAPTPTPTPPATSPPAPVNPTP